MKRAVIFVVGGAVLLAVLGGYEATSGLQASESGLPAEFSLAAGGEASTAAFSLAPRTAESRALAGPGGGGLLEDQDYPYNTAIGWQALYIANTTGKASFCDTATGFRALYSNDGGHFNTANGREALYSNTTGEMNTAMGDQALYFNTEAWGSTAVGFKALYNSTSGQYNTGIGHDALIKITSGSYNVALGDMAGLNSTTGSWNIFLGTNSGGSGNETNTIRIGMPYNPDAMGQDHTYIAGIVENPIAAVLTPAVVGITSDGRLGTVPPESLPPGPAGPQGPQGLPGEGLISGSLLLLPAGMAMPPGYLLIGTTEFVITRAGARRTSKITVNILQKQ